MTDATDGIYYYTLEHFIIIMNYNCEKRSLLHDLFGNDSRAMTLLFAFVAHSVSNQCFSNAFSLQIARTFRVLVIGYPR